MDFLIKENEIVILEMLYFNSPFTEYTTASRRKSCIYLNLCLNSCFSLTKLTLIIHYKTLTLTRKGNLVTCKLSWKQQNK